MKEKKLNLTLKLLIRALDEIVYNPPSSQDEECLSWIQRTCLRYIYYHTAPNRKKPVATEVAEALMISNAAVTKLLDRLEKKGYLKREFNLVDRRQVSLTLTKTGGEMILAQDAKEEGMLKAILNRLSVEEEEQLFQGLNSFMEAALVDKEMIDKICLRCGWLHRKDCPGNQIYHTLTGEDKTNV